MMWEWAGQQPQCCLKLGTDAVAWAEMERDWRGRRRHRCVASPLPDGLLKPSPTDPNVSDTVMLQGRIRTLAGLQAEGQRDGEPLLSTLPRRITLLLPDTAVRAMVLHLDEFPARSDEREALIRWRLGQEQLFPLAGAKVVSQRFHAVPGEERRAHTVLAVAIQESVLQQYEALCESVGLIPHEVGLTSLRLCDLWRRASGGLGRKKTEFLWANVADRSLTTMVFQQGRPLFYRCKLMGGNAIDAGEPSGVLDNIIEECGTSLDVCQQRYPDVVIKHAIVCVDGELAGLKTKLEAGLDLSVEQVGWSALERLGVAAKEGHQGMASLAAMAGVS
ncbi:MAG: hypothetical protein HP491_01425 [Nitrospira sp.]|nr:hypothetical protein [Nitrospira sp.]